MKIIILLLSCHLFSQNDSIFSKFKKIELQKIDSLISSNLELDKYKFLALLPSIGISTGQNLVSEKTIINFSFAVNISNLSNYFQTKYRNKLELKKFENEMKNDLSKKILDLVIEFQNIMLEYESLLIDIEVFDNQKKNFSIKNEQYKNNKINLEDYLGAEITYTKNYKNIILKHKILINKMNNYEDKIKNSCFWQEFRSLEILMNKFN